ncbi:ABC transporter ATP-binding protein [Marihabitans asiaticum]|uniref:ABC-type quaternary amine transporter n=1 Tax=Marihabitans asiaticum TaxID=415218 RepID=A0A560WDT4_9MICO|nr:ABC transporter ATP-binding protein [Marihabitans asiaticum]TWD15829.1 iron(III) transport system ATP-binding protein [Marihabitans asiaticum]
MSAPVLDLDAVTKRFGATTAVDEVSLQMTPGEVLVVVGPSGCGKSTMLRIIAGLVGIDAGTVSLAGREVAGEGVFVPVEERGVGIVFQDLALFPHLSVADNVGFGLGTARRGRGRRRDEGRARVAELLELVGLADKAERYPHQLSGGEQQRVAIARALALQPPLVLLDEPFSHLDKGLSARVRTEAMDALRAAGASVVLVTHDQEEALAVGDRVAVMRDGVLVQVGTPAEIFHAPADEFVATFLGEADFLAGERRGSAALTALGELPVLPGPDGRVQVMVRPHDLTVHPRARGHQLGGEGGVPGRVARAEFRGGQVMHLVTLADGVSVRCLTDHRDAQPKGAEVLVPRPLGHPLVAFPA